MKQHPFYLTSIPFFVFVLLAIQACKPGSSFPYNEDNVKKNIISIKTAEGYTASYRRGVIELSKRMGDSNFLKSNFQLPVAVQFNKDVLALLLNQRDSSGKNAAGVRMYFARNEQNQVTLVLVPYDNANNDIRNRLIKNEVVTIPGVTSAYAQLVNAQAVDNGLRCPTFCDQRDTGLSGPIQLISPVQ